MFFMGLPWLPTRNLVDFTQKARWINRNSFRKRKARHFNMNRGQLEAETSEVHQSWSLQSWNPSPWTEVMDVPGRKWAAGQSFGAPLMRVFYGFTWPGPLFDLSFGQLQRCRNFEKLWKTFVLRRSPWRLIFADLCWLWSLRSSATPSWGSNWETQLFQRPNPTGDANGMVKPIS